MNEGPTSLRPHHIDRFIEYFHEFHNIFDPVLNFEMHNP